ncbi:MAG: hypothetical protein C4532_06870 [Candidatus Abyssobacteria bacterium SURF_17]|uniref:Uncharacterized protein n=1 Tax=Candidatus Abyssobacteria bacterium SURF_17 TaxID=2093361 RepID=A0A419F1C3_9BACT|nr:MAG: hypothetical protein C4532_06870 [Candidatus Abyssubacteria bacterium SURF_17]
MTTSNQYGISPAPRKATGGVIALGVINIIYAALFRLCCGLTSVLSTVFAAAFAGFLANMPQAQRQQMLPFEMMRSGPMQAYSIINGFVLLLLGILLLFAGIGLLKLRPWSRSLSIGWAVAEIVWVLISFAITVFFVYPAMMEMMGAEFPQGSHMVFSVVSAMFSALMSLVYPIVLLICLNLRSIKGQFEPEMAQP